LVAEQVLQFFGPRACKTAFLRGICSETEVSDNSIEDQSERFIPLDRNVKDADTVKKITLKSPGGDAPLFVITLVEHQSTVNFHTSARLFQAF
jgi:hypothetical protein